MGGTLPVPVTPKFSEKNLSFEDAKYLVHLPWKEQHGLLPDNFENCVARLSSQLKRLK